MTACTLARLHNSPSLQHPTPFGHTGSIFACSPGFARFTSEVRPLCRCAHMQSCKVERLQHCNVDHIEIVQKFWKFLKYIKEEVLIVLGTSSSEVALPRIIVKLERLGCSKSVVGLVVPSGYSFNLDGTAIYLTIAALFVAQATNTHLSGSQEFTMLMVLMLTSKGAAAVTGGGFITLAATLSSLGTVPVA